MCGGRQDQPRAQQQSGIADFVGFDLESTQFVILKTLSQIKIRPYSSKAFNLVGISLTKAQVSTPFAVYTCTYSRLTSPKNRAVNHTFLINLAFLMAGINRLTFRLG
jgi:hypothetical protein